MRYDDERMMMVVLPAQRSLVIISVRLLQAYLLINQFYFKCSFGYISAVG